MLDDTKSRILSATCKAVRQYGLDGVRISNISELAGLSPGALYRYFESKEELLRSCFVHIDQQVAQLFEKIPLVPELSQTDPLGTVRKLWTPYFRFWTARPDETVFYHRFHDAAAFKTSYPKCDVDRFGVPIQAIRFFTTNFPSLQCVDQDLLWLHVLTSTVMYAEYVVEGALPNDPETEEEIFQFILRGLSYVLLPTN